MLKKGIALTAVGIFVVFGIIAVLLAVNPWETRARSSNNKGDDQMSVNFEQVLNGTSKSVNVALFWNETTKRNETREKDVKFPTIDSLGFAMAGWSFVGWKSNLPGAEVITSEYFPAGLHKGMGQITFEGIWAGDDFMITFSMAGTDIRAPYNFQVTVGQTINGLSGITNNNGQAFIIDQGPFHGNQVFKGWRTEPNGKGVLITDGTVYQFNHGTTFHPSFGTPGTIINNNFTVTFNPQGGTVVNGNTTATATAGTPFNFTQSAIRTGFTFNGWFTDATGGARIQSGINWVAAVNRTLFAQWTPIDNPNPVLASVTFQYVRASDMVTRVAQDVTVTQQNGQPLRVGDTIRLRLHAAGCSNANCCPPLSHGSRGFDDCPIWQFQFFQIGSNQWTRFILTPSACGQDRYLTVTLTENTVIQVAFTAR